MVEYTYEQLREMSPSQLRAEYSKIGARINKRMQRAEKAGENLRAYGFNTSRVSLSASKLNTVNAKEVFNLQERANAGSFTRRGFAAYKKEVENVINTVRHSQGLPALDKIHPQTLKAVSRSLIGAGYNVKGKYEQGLSPAERYYLVIEMLTGGQTNKALNVETSGDITKTFKSIQPTASTRQQRGERITSNDINEFYEQNKNAFRF